MNTDIKRFIEQNIGFIEHNEFVMLYNQAYEWLSDWQCGELTELLETALNTNLQHAVTESLTLIVINELKTAASENRFDTPLRVSSFVRLYLNNILGMNWDDFSRLLEQIIKTNRDLNLKTIVDVTNDVLIVNKKHY